MNFLIISICTLLFLSPNNKIYSQSKNSQQRDIFFYNLGFGGIVGGVGALVNKEKGERWNKALFKGIWQGTLGGLFNYCGKKTLYQVGKNYSLRYAWPAKIIHDAGTSIIENAAAHRPFLQTWHTNIGFARLDFSFSSEQRTQIRFLPVALYSIIQGFSNGRFSLSQSLYSGNLTFVTDQPNIMQVKGEVGFSFGRSIIYFNDVERYSTIAHELIHQFQFDEYQTLNLWLLPLNKRIKSQTIKTVFSKYIYLDVPYFAGAYFLQGGVPDRYLSQNLYELEAESLSTNKYVK